LLAIGYQAILAPFIPIMWSGDELMRISHNATNCLYFFSPEIEKLREIKENREFYEKVKKLISIRRNYPEIFSYFPENHRNSNICKVESSSDLQAYARFKDNKAVLVIPNYSDTEKEIKFSIPFADCGLDSQKPFSVTNLMTDEKMEPFKKCLVSIQKNEMAVILVEQNC